MESNPSVTSQQYKLVALPLSYGPKTILLDHSCQFITSEKLHAGRALTTVPLAGQFKAE